MDDRLRRLARRADAGDHDAQTALFREEGRSGFALKVGTHVRLDPSILDATPSVLIGNWRIMLAHVIGGQRVFGLSKLIDLDGVVFLGETETEVPEHLVAECRVANEAPLSTDEPVLWVPCPECDALIMDACDGSGELHEARTVIPPCPPTPEPLKVSLLRERTRESLVNVKESRSLKADLRLRPEDLPGPEPTEVQR